MTAHVSGALIIKPAMRPMQHQKFTAHMGVSIGQLLNIRSTTLAPKRLARFSVVEREPR